jgi:hypothetical protein
MAPEQQLNEYLHRLMEFDADNAVAFNALFREGMELLDLRAGEICEQFDVTGPTVRHWREGVSAPHPAVARLILDSMRQRAESQGARVLQHAAVAA